MSTFFFRLKPVSFKFKFYTKILKFELFQHKLNILLYDITLGGGLRAGCRHASENKLTFCNI